MTNLLYPVWVILAIDIIVQMEVILGLGDKCILHIHTYYVLHIYSTFCTVPSTTVRVPRVYTVYSAWGLGE